MRRIYHDRTMAGDICARGHGISTHVFSSVVSLPCRCGIHDPGRERLCRNYSVDLDREYHGGPSLPHRLHLVCMRVGIGAALMLATAEYHLVFSRLALTDATFTLLFWAALWCLFEAISTGKRHWFVAGGVVTGLCWNTKYHGFLPLAITGLCLKLRPGSMPLEANVYRSGSFPSRCMSPSITRASTRQSRSIPCPV